MKILLDVNDVDKLLTGQTEAGVELKNYVVAEFVRRHLKGIVNEEMVAIASKAARDIANGALRINDYKLQPWVEDSIRDLVGRKFDSIVYDEIDKIKSELETRVSKAIKEHEHKYTELINELLELSDTDVKGKILAKLWDR